MNKTRVFIVDDSALMRELLSALFSNDPELEVAGTAADPIIAKRKLAAAGADVMTLDVEMPKMNGLDFLTWLMKEAPMPVVMISSTTERGCGVTLRALELGAVDFVQKPKIDIARGTLDLGGEIVAKIKAAGKARVRTPRRAPAPLPRITTPATFAHLPRTQRIVAIGSSTGGTEALVDILTELPADAPPIVVVQHMPPVFTRKFAERLDGICRVRVKEAAHLDALVQGQVLIAPGGASHAKIVQDGAVFRVALTASEPVNHQRPSVDVLFESCARAAGPNATGVILTGMGADGARGLLAMRRAGATTIAEHESTCVVFGMPKEAIACGAAQHVVPLDRIAHAILRASSDSTHPKHTDPKKEEEMS